MLALIGDRVKTCHVGSGTDFIESVAVRVV